MFKKLKSTLFLMLAVSSFAAISLPASVLALVEDQCPDGYTVRFNPGGTPSYDELCRDHQTGTSGADSQQANGAATTQANSSSRQGDCKAKGNNDLTPQNCGILSYLLDAINLLSAIVGIVVVIMIAWGGIQYSASRDNPQATAAAKAKIVNALLGLVAYLFIYAFLQYIIPGGVL